VARYLTRRQLSFVLKSSNWPPECGKFEVLKRFNVSSGN
jgi:hypothetical protein